jgi:cytochrome c-type biogenesis protein CcmH/NrfG
MRDSLNNKSLLNEGEVSYHIKTKDPNRLLTELRSLTARKQFAKTLPLLCALISQRPRDLRARLNLAVILFILKEPREAVSVYHGVLSEDPANGEARQGLAKIHLQNGDYKEARAFLPEILLLKTGDASVSKLWPEVRQAFLELEGR